MPFRDQYLGQVRLLMRLLPIVARETCFALKGGTAINLFIRNMPRLSVDIDLVYLPIDERSKALAEIDAALKRIKQQTLKTFAGAHVTETVSEGGSSAPPGDGGRLRGKDRSLTGASWRRI